MCIICIDLQKDIITPREAWRHLNEMQDSLEEEHVEEVVENIWDKLHSRTLEDEKELELWMDLMEYGS